MDNIEKQEIICHYEDLLQKVTEPEDLSFIWEKKSLDQGNLIVASADKDGLLTVLAGLLTSYGAEIVSGDIISVVDDHNPSQRKILDILYLKWPEGEIAERLLGNFKNDLDYCNKKIVIEGIESVRNWVIDKVAVLFSSQNENKKGILPVEIEIDNESSETDTVLRIESQDTPGFLFAFSNSLSLLSINIDRATIRTASDLVQNVFYVRDLKGRKIMDQEKLDELRFICALIKQFAYLLPNAPNPGQAISQFRDFASKSLLTPQRSDILPSM
ncbi:MAG: hypothetical protein C0614_10935, partial [Desulfuromonas sp.]